LRSWEENPRTIAPERLAQLKEALCADPEMLRARPLVATPDGTVILGNQRLRGVQELGWESVPVLFVDLEPDRARLWALRDNNSYGEWDERRLSELLAELSGAGVDLELAGFASADLDRLLAGIGAGREPDDVPSLPVGVPDSVPGRVYELGPHRLLCGDATDREQVLSLAGGEVCEVFLTDAPYGVGYVGRTKRALTIRNDGCEGLPMLLEEAFVAADAVLAPSARFYVAAPAGPNGTVFRLAVQAVGWQLHQTLVWVKDSIVVGHCDYHFRHEDILYGWKPGGGRPGRGRHKGTRWFGDNSQSSVFFIDKPARSAEHPTMKPVELIAAMLRNSSRRGDVVLDSFAGSGSTLIACEMLGRRCFAIEIDPAYCDVIRRRYEEYVDGR
jgi:DNA modification methylase